MTNHLFRWSLDLGQEFGMYAIERAKPSWKPSTDSYGYWQAALPRFPTLASHALKTLEFPLSSIAAERAFATMRIIDAPQRRAQTLETFSREAALRVNKKYTERNLDLAIARVLAV
jgi:hypothetical protein